MYSRTNACAYPQMQIKVDFPKRTFLWILGSYSTVNICMYIYVIYPKFYNLVVFKTTSS